MGEIQSVVVLLGGGSIWLLFRGSIVCVVFWVVGWGSETMIFSECILFRGVLSFFSGGCGGSGERFLRWGCSTHDIKWFLLLH